MFWLNLGSEDRERTLSGQNEKTAHVPIMCDEVLDYLACAQGKNYLDLTVGGGGHAEKILKRTAPKGILVGSDRDADALRRAGSRLETFGRRVKLTYGAISEVLSIVKNSGVASFDGVLIDCGVSSDQLDEAERGFSFRKSGPLDMRMDQSKGFTAADWLAQVKEKELADVIFQYGEERHSRRIAKVIVAARKKTRLESTGQLADIVRQALPRTNRGVRIDPATRTFQAIRIAINDELKELETGLRDILWKFEGVVRVVVITFHSLEDRIVKTVFKAAERASLGKVLTKKPIRPTQEECAANPRARSAKLRAFELTGGRS